jgi:hypothetical protein
MNAVVSGKQPSFKVSQGRNPRGLGLKFRALIVLFGLLCGYPALSRAQSQPPAAPDPAASPTAKPATQGALGSITGVVADQTGSLLEGAQVRLSRQGQPLAPDTVSAEDGQFSFTGVTPGPFQVEVTAAGFAAPAVSGTLHAGEAYVAPQVVLTIAAQTTTITVSAGMPRVEVAEFQIQDQEKQRVLGIVPNFYVSYVPNAISLTAKQKFELAWKSSVDPFTFVGTGALAGIEQASDELNGYGQGMQGYGKRYGAGYGDVVIGTFIGSAVLPSVFKQDPRYFYKGTGSTRSRILYALASPFICKGDNGDWQPNYSYVGGNFAGAAISNLYYPASDRHGPNLLLQTAGIRFGENALSAVLQEFVFRKLTRHLPPSER